MPVGIVEARWRCDTMADKSKEHSTTRRVSKCNIAANSARLIEIGGPGRSSDQPHIRCSRQTLQHNVPTCPTALHMQATRLTVSHVTAKLDLRRLSHNIVAAMPLKKAARDIFRTCNPRVLKESQKGCIGHRCITRTGSVVAITGIKRCPGQHVGTASLLGKL